MNKERLILIFVIFFVLIVGAFLVFSEFSDDSNTFRLDAAKFTLPEGYHSSIKITSAVAETINITNGKNVYYVVEYKEGDLNKSIKDYVKRIESKNSSVDITVFSCGGIDVYASHIENDTHTRQFWFNNHNHLYSIYTWNADNNTDNVVKFLIESMQFPIF